jgi:hypothetical protein
MREDLEAITRKAQATWYSALPPPDNNFIGKQVQRSFTYFRVSSQALQMSQKGRQLQETVEFHLKEPVMTLTA